MSIWKSSLACAAYVACQFFSDSWWGLSRGALLNFMDVSGIEALPSTRGCRMCWKFGCSVDAVAVKCEEGRSRLRREFKLGRWHYAKRPERKTQHPVICFQLLEDAMDWNRVEGNWKQVKGKVKEQWGKLTDDDLDVIAGKQDQLEGKLQERYGYAKDQAQKEMNDWYGRQGW
jgi:uncharacterized protein YjbJ (UPF0337 family)